MTIKLADLNDHVMSAGRDDEILVAASDPEGGLYTKVICVPKTEAALKCAMGFRRLTGYERDEMIGEPEDFTADWKHSD